ncbi:E3 ubiquitin/ISG15 ligase TRIM25-like [Dendropsophus ebraccatus]|uniref:E3 ubiquitin/ISG15 ligase TRIM25-like n=1 Tax=Dendropsophus ebraccatus TaxID=150705 RepID=UPI0038316C9C
MASAHLMDELTCSICLNIYTDPVTLRCGHNFCRECIERVLEKSGHCRCPECRAHFAERPALQRNIALHNIAERFHSAHADVEDTAISCTYCIHLPATASKSCIHCEAALCEEHLRVHSKSPEHVLVEPGCSLEMRKCPTHKKILEYYCMQDSTCICVSCCLTGEHVGHKVVPRKEEQEPVSEMKEIKLAMKMGHLEREAHHDANICNLQDCTMDSGDVGGSDPEEDLLWTMLGKRFAHLGDYLRTLCSIKKTPPQTSKRVNRRVRDLLLDIATAGPNLEILEGLRTVAWSGGIHSYPETSESFLCSQVLSSTSFDSGKHKWKLETSAVGNWRLGVSYGSMARRGVHAIVGNNQKSWCLLRAKQQYSVIHNDREIQLRPDPSCCMIGIVLDYEAGRLTFYELCDPIRHLYTFNVTFTEPLYAAVWIHNAWVRIRLYDYVTRDYED